MYWLLSLCRAVMLKRKGTVRYLPLCPLGKPPRESLSHRRLPFRETLSLNRPEVRLECRRHFPQTRHLRRVLCFEIQSLQS